MTPKICLCLTGATIEEDLRILDEYRSWIDIAELRVDYLCKDERLQIRKFPALAGVPCILTIRRVLDGGKFAEGEAARTLLFARGLAFADQDSRKNFAYVDFEEDFQVPSLQDAAFAFGTRVIRSCHSMHEPVTNIAEHMQKMRITGYEIPKIACMPNSIRETAALFHEAKLLSGFEHILCAMGPYGAPTRILAERLGSFLTYTSPKDAGSGMAALGHIDPVTLNEVYNFRGIDAKTKIFGVTGYPLEITQSPALHNAGYRRHGMNSVYIPIRAQKIEEALDFARELDITGLSVTIPHKESVLDELQSVSSAVGEIGSCNTIVRSGDGWTGFNTDSSGLIEALQEFLRTDTLRHTKVAIIGAGGAARAAVYAVRQMHGSMCVFNRTVSRARTLAEEYNCKWAALDETAVPLLERYSDLIIQTTSVGMGCAGPSDSTTDPLYFYGFQGHEAVYDVIYSPELTPLLARAKEAGCRVSNGLSMLRYQAYRQFKLFTGVEYDEEHSSAGTESIGRRHGR